MRFHHITGLLLAAAACSTASAADPQQDREPPLRILVAVPAGGVSDIVARLIAVKLQASLARPVVVENRTGASGRIAVDVLKRAPADGSVLLLVPIIVPVIGPLVFKSLTYSATRDLMPVTQVAKYEFAFAVRADHPARDVRAWVEWAKATAPRATFGTPGAGSLAHFLGFTLGRATGVEMLHVPYQGVGQLEVDLIGGEIGAGIAGVSDLLALHREGRIRILATSGTSRSPSLPAVPMFREQGYPTVEAIGWHAVYAPPGTAPQLIDKLSSAIVAALQAPDLRAKLMALSLEPTGTTAGELAGIMAADSARWAPIVKSAGFNTE